MATYQVRIDADGEKVLSAPLSGLEGGIATADAPGVVQPDGTTVRVDNTGILSAIGGNLLLNSEEWITESGEWTAPVTGWYALTLFNGGNSGIVNTTYKSCHSGTSGHMATAFMYLSKGQKVPVTIGAGGASPAVNTNQVQGGTTSFGDFSATRGDDTFKMCEFEGVWTPQGMPSGVTMYYTPGGGICGGYPGNPAGGNMTQAQKNERCNGYGHFGGGGAAVLASDGQYGIGAGAQGCVYVRWHDPAKAAGLTE